MMVKEAVSLRKVGN